MTTAAIQPEKTAPSPEPDVASVFYGSEGTKQSDQDDPSTVTSEPGTSVTPEAAPTVSAEVPKADSQKGDESVKVEQPKGKADEKPDEEKGHVAAARRLGQEVASLKKEFQVVAEENRVLKAKLDGTYQEPVKPSPEEAEKIAEFRGRETASRKIAMERFGEDVVNTQVYQDESPYKKLIESQPWLKGRVVMSEQPAVEAVLILKEADFRAQYGNDPTQWVAKIEEGLKPKLLEELKKQVTTTPVGGPAPTITEGRGSGGGTARERTAEEVFYGKS